LPIFLTFVSVLLILTIGTNIFISKKCQYNNKIKGEPAGKMCEVATQNDH